MFKTTDVLLVVALALSGCAVSPPAAKDCTLPVPAADNAAEVVVYRPHIQAGSLVSYGIAIDSCNVGELEDSAIIRHKVVPGKHKVQTEKSDITNEFKAGTTTYIRFWMVNTGKVVMWWHGNIYEHVPKLAVVEKETAAEEMRGLKTSGE